MKTDEQLKLLLKNRLSEKRYIHSLNVAEASKRLAALYGADENKAYTAGLIHDCCKDTPAGEQLSYMLGNSMELSECEISSAKLYHAMCGSLYVKNEYGVTDADIINAVRYHTTGRKNMSLLEKIVFIADFISDERDYNGVEVMREKAGRSLDEAIVEGLAFTIKDLIDKGVLLHPDTIDAYNDALLNLIKKQRQEKSNES